MGLGMRVVVAGAACAGWLASVAPSEAGPPALLAEARYVALGYDLGTGFVADDPRVDVLPEERTALQRIRAGLDTWNKYVVVPPLWESFRAEVVKQEKRAKKP